MSQWIERQATLAHCKINWYLHFELTKIEGCHDFFFLFFFFFTTVCKDMYYILCFSICVFMSFLWEYICVFCCCFLFLFILVFFFLFAYLFSKEWKVYQGKWLCRIIYGCIFLHSLRTNAKKLNFYILFIMA